MGDKKDTSNQPRLDSWDDFAGEYIKAEFVKEIPSKLVVIKVEGRNEDGRNKVLLTVEYNKRTWLFDINKTNMNFIRSKEIYAPKDIMGKVLIVEKTRVRNPATNSLVDSLIITDIQ